MTETRGATALPDRRPEGGRPERASRPALPARVALYYRQVIAELRKVIWPSRRQLVTYTGVVIAFVLAVIAFVTLVDLLFGRLVFAVFG